MFHKQGFQMYKSIKKPPVKESSRLRLINLIANRQEFEKQNPYPPYSTHPTTVNFSDIEGKTLLHYAIEAGDLNDVKRLVEEAGADIDVRVNGLGRRTPFEVALQNGQLEIAKYLYEKKVICSKTPLSLAALSCRDWLLGIIQKEVIPGEAYNSQWFDEWGNSDSLLKPHRATETGDLDYLKEILNDPIQIAHFKKVQPPLLNLAAANGQLEVIDFLSQKGFLVNPSIAFHESALQAAICGGKLTSASRLMALGADINWQDNRKYTPLFIAIENKNIQAVKLLIENNADITFKDVFGNTVLHQAVASGDKDILKELLLHSHGSMLCAMKNCYGETPLDLAKKSGNTQMLQLLSPGMATESFNQSTLKALNQTHIIRNFIYYLRCEYRETDAANPEGYCNGFEFLFHYYTGKGMGDYFFNTLELLANWNGDKSTPMFEKLKEWLNDASWFQHSIEGYHITYQADRAGQYALVEKTPEYMPFPLSDNYGGFGTGDNLDEQQLNELLSIFSKMPKETRVSFGGGDHATGAWFDDKGDIIYFDSNHRRRTAPLDNPQDLVTLLINTKYIWVKRNTPENKVPFVFHLFCFAKDKQRFNDPDYHIFSPADYPRSEKAARLFQNNSPNQLGHLHIAIMTRCLASLKRLLDDGFCDINAKGTFANQTPLELAFRWDFTEAISLMLNHPKLALDNPPFLVKAYSKKMFDVVDAIIANPKSKNLDELMITAINENDVETIKKLIEHKKVDVMKNGSFLYHANDCDRPEIVDYLLQNGASPVAVFRDKTPVGQVIYDWSTYRKQKSFKKILQHLPNLDVLDDLGMAAIHYAMEYGKPEIVKWLLKKGANPAVANKDQQTIKDFFLASARSCSLECYQLIQSSTFPFDWHDPKDAALIHKILFHCVAFYNDDLFNQLLTEAPIALLNKPNEEGITLLHAAVINKEYHLAETLICAGVDINAKTKKSGNTCLHAIANSEYGFSAEFLKLFLANGARLDIPNNTNKTAHEFIQGSSNEEFLALVHHFQNDEQEQEGNFKPLL